jgi:hypothetical protein
MRQRAADDVETIYENIQRLKREKEEVLGQGTGEIIQPPCDTEQDTQDYACGLPSWAVEPQRRMFEELKSREPGEFTDGA